MLQRLIACTGCYLALQVNYRYDLDHLTNNNQAYVHDREIAVSDRIAAEARNLAVLWSPN